MKSGALSSKSLAQLREMAAELDVVGRHKMGKEQLIDAILDARAKVAERQQKLQAASARPLSARAPARVGAVTPAAKTRGAAPAGRKTTASPKGKATVKVPAARKPAAAAPKAKVEKKPVSAKPSAAKAPAPRKLAPAAKKAAPAKKVTAASTPKSAPKPASKAAKPAAAPARKAPVKLAAPAKTALPVRKKVAASPAPKKVGGESKRPVKPAPRSEPAAPVAARKTAPPSKKEAPKAERPTVAAPKPEASKPQKAAPAAPKPGVDRPVPPKSTAVPAGKPAATSRGPIRPIRKVVPKRVRRHFPLSPAAPPIPFQAGDFGEPPVKPARKAARPAQPAPQAPSPVEPPEHDTIPTIYQQDDRVVLMARDPQWLYCYWELGDSTMRALQESIDRFGGDLVLRVHNVTDVVYDGTNCRGHQDIVLPRQAEGSWYFQTLGEDIDHLIEIGIRTSDGKFLAIVRSNTVRTPRAAAGAPESDQRQAMLADLAQERAAAEASAQEAVSSHPSSPLKPIGPHGPQPVGAPAPSSPFGAWAPSSPFGAFGEAPTVLAAPPVEKQRGFWLVVDCELIVYGATVPGSRLRIQGQPMELRPDGTFSLRFAFPDGRQVIPVEATSADGVDRREITPIVERRTESSEESTE